MNQHAPLPQPNEGPARCASRLFWPRWSERLRRWDLDGPVALLLEAAGPLSIFLAQIISVGQPFLGAALPGDQAGALISMLEDQQAAGQFAALLREEGSH